MDQSAVEAVLVPLLKAGFLLVLLGGVAAVVRELAQLARSRRRVPPTAEKGKD